MGERVNGIHEVSGSIPLGSTNKIKHLVGSSEAMKAKDLLRVMAV